MKLGGCNAYPRKRSANLSHHLSSDAVAQLPLVNMSTAPSNEPTRHIGSAVSRAASDYDKLQAELTSRDTFMLPSSGRRRESDDTSEP